MGRELYCGTPGTVNVWNNTVDYWELKNITPEELGRYMYNDVMKSWPDLNEKLKKDPNDRNPIGLFIKYPERPVLSYEDLKEYAFKIRTMWENAARKKVNECRKEKKEFETLHLREIETNGLS